MLRERPEPKGRELVVEVAALAFGHRGNVPFTLRNCGPPLHHLPHRAPDGEGRDRPWRPEAGQGEGDTRMVADEALDGLAPMEEPRHFPQVHPSDGDGHDGLTPVPVAGDRKSVV